MAIKQLRSYLYVDEVRALVDEAMAQGGRLGMRNAAMIVMAYRHGFRVSELISLRWDQLDWNCKQLHVFRLKHGNPSVHFLSDEEMHFLRSLQRTAGESAYIFLSTRGKPMTRRNFARILARLGERAGLSFLPHPHQLRHACGHRLAMMGEDTRAIQDWLGHTNINSTVRYTRITPERFRSFRFDVAD
ncbi:MAG: tyrosine-type recombinase/integrase [Cyanobacteria bacterium J06639_1]